MSDNMWTARVPATNPAPVLCMPMMAAVVMSMRALPVWPVWLRQVEASSAPEKMSMAPSKGVGKACIQSDHLTLGQNQIQVPQALILDSELAGDRQS